MLVELKAAIAAGRYYLGPHAGLRQWERDLSTDKLEEAFGADAPEIVEDYPDDPRGHSVLLLGMTEEGQLLHLVCKVTDPVFAITCYEPDPDVWYPDFKRRR